MRSTRANCADGRRLDNFDEHHINAYTDLCFKIDADQRARLRAEIKTALGRDLVGGSYGALKIAAFVRGEDSADGSSSVPLTIRDRDDKGREVCLSCTLATLWGWWYWAKTEGNSARYVSEHDRKRFCAFFNVPTDPDDVDDNDGSLAEVLGERFFVADELLVVVTGAAEGKLEFSDVLSVDVSAPALWADRIARSLRA